MTAINVTFRYQGDLAMAALRRLTDALAVYGMRGLAIDEAARTMTVEYDATRLDNDMIAAIVRGCGVRVGEPVEPAVA